MNTFIVNYHHEEVLLTIEDIHLYGKAIMDMATFQDLDHQVQHIVPTIINTITMYPCRL